MRSCLKQHKTNSSKPKTKHTHTYTKPSLSIVLIYKLDTVDLPQKEPIVTEYQDSLCPGRVKEEPDLLFYPPGKLHFHLRSSEPAHREGFCLKIGPIIHLRADLEPPKSQIRVLFCLVWASEARGSAVGQEKGHRLYSLSVRSHFGGRIENPGLQALPYSSFELTQLAVHDGAELNQGWSCGPRVRRAVVHESLVSLRFLKHLTFLATHRGRLCVPSSHPH